MFRLLREGGAIGDSLCVGAVVQQLHHEQRCVVEVYAPTDYTDIYTHLGVDRFIPLGTVAEIKARGRRDRGGPIDPDKYPYLSPLRGVEADVIDLWSVAELYEQACTLPRVDKSRAELFCAAAGCRGVDHAQPLWGFHLDDPTVDYAIGDSRKLRVAVALQAAALERTYPRIYAEHLVKGLLNRGLRPIIIDVVEPHYIIPNGAVRAIGLPLTSVARILDNCWGAICVDSGMLHLAEAVLTPTIGLFGCTSPTTVNTYYFCRPLEGVDTRCTEPCTRRPAWGYTSKCARNGCVRMMSLNPETVLAEVDVWLGTRRPTSTEIPIEPHKCPKCRDTKPVRVEGWTRKYELFTDWCHCITCDYRWGGQPRRETQLTQ